MVLDGSGTDDAGSTVVEGFVDSSSTTGFISTSSCPPVTGSFATGVGGIGSVMAVPPAATAEAGVSLLLPLRAGPFDGSRVAVGVAVGSVSRPSRDAAIVYARSKFSVQFVDQVEKRGRPFSAPFATSFVSSLTSSSPSSS